LIYQIHPDTQHLDGPFSGTFRLDRSESHSFHATALAPICPRGGKDHGHRIGQVLGHVASPLDHRDFHGDFMELFLTNNMRGIFFVISNLFPRENSSPSGIELWLYPHGVTMAKHGGMKKTMVTGCSILGG